MKIFAILCAIAVVAVVSANALTKPETARAVQSGRDESVRQLQSASTKVQGGIDKANQFVQEIEIPETN